MKTLQNHFTFKSIENYYKSIGKNETANITLKDTEKGVAKYVLNVLFPFSLFIILFGCGKPSNNPSPNVVNISACTITSDVDEALGSRLFEYDNSGLLVKVTSPNYYYGPFVRTISPAQVEDAYPTESVNSSDGTHTKGTISTAYIYTGGSGNIYDGNPEYMSEVFTQSPPTYSFKTDSIFQFVYDDAKKHLTTVFMQGSGSVDPVGFSLYRYELDFAYDANDNVTDVKIFYDWSKKTIVYPSVVGHIDYKQTSVGFLTIAYDDKPSAYKAISKYWKFIGEDFKGFNAYNLDKVRFWANRCEILSKNNPVKITGKLLLDTATPLDVDANLTYQYNEKDFPVSMSINGAGVQAFTYNCK